MPYIIAPLTPTRRPAFTLTELLIALSLTLVIGGTAATILARQLRLHRALRTIIMSRTHTRHAAFILPADLRAATDSLRFASDTAVELFTTLGVSFICTTPTATSLTLPPDTLANGNTLTAFIATPDAGDELAVFHDSSAISPRRIWTRHAITSVSRAPTASACPPASSFTTPLDTKRAYTITLPAPITPAPAIGTPLRFLRQARYNVYRASDGQYYLGYRRCPFGTCTAVQPISGPYASNTAPPIEFRYFAPNGARVASPLAAAVSRIDVVTRVQSRAITLPGRPDSLFTDSAVTTIALRNTP